MIEMSDFKNAPSSGNKPKGGIRINLEDDEEEEEVIETDYEHKGANKALRKGPPYAAFNETRHKTQDSDPSMHLGSQSPDQEEIQQYYADSGDETRKPLVEKVGTQSIFFTRI